MFWFLYYNLYYVVSYTIIIQGKHCYLVIFYNKKTFFLGEEKKIYTTVFWREGMGDWLV